MVENPYLQEADRLDIYGSGGALIIATDFASKNYLCIREYCMTKLYKHNEMGHKTSSGLQ